MNIPNPNDGIQDDILTTVIADTGILAGTLLADRFLIEEELGRGGQASVYRAHDQVTDKIIAIKVLARRTELSETAIQQLRDELLAARKISATNIIRVHEFYRDADYVFYTMDYIAGETLADRLSGKVTMADAERWLQQLLSGIQACHRGQIIHGDIKPANLLINERHDLIVADFGISAVHGAAVNRGSGSVGYRAPELDDGENASPAVDIYALGKVIERVVNAVPKQGLRVQLWRLRWLKRAQKMLEIRPEKRPTLAAVIQQTSAASPWRSSILVALAVLLVGAVVLQQTYRDREPPAAAPADLSEATRIAFVKTAGSGDADRIVQMLSVTYSGEKELSVMYAKRVDELVEQLGLKPFQSDRDRQRLAALLNVTTLVFIETSVTEDSSGDHVQVYLHDYPVNQIVGVATFSLANGVLSTYQEIYEHLGNYLTVHKYATSSDALSADLASVVVQIQAAESFEQIEQLQLQHQQDYQNLAAFWFALAQGASSFEENEKAHALLEQLFTHSASEGASYWILQGRVLEANLHGDLESAAAALDALLMMYPNRPIILEQRAAIAQQMDDVALAEQLLENALKIDPNSGNLWFELGRLRINQGDIQGAIHHELAQGLIRYRQQEDLFGQGTILNALGVAYFRLGNDSEARSYFEQALTVRKENNDLAGQAVTLGNLANVLAIQQEYAAADMQLQKAADIFAQLNDHRGTAQVMNVRGYLAEEQGIYESAVRYFRSALDLRMRYGSTEEQAETINNVAFVYFLSGDFSQADIFWRQANTLFSRIDHQSGRLRTELQLANLHLHRGEYQTATRMLANVSNDIDENRPIEQAFLNFLFSMRNFGLGNIDAAMSNAALAIEQAVSIQDYRAIIENSLWKLEMCFWLADVECFLTTQEQLKTFQDAFTREQSVVFAWLSWSYQHVTENSTAASEQQVLKNALNDTNLPLHTELKIRLALWELAPEALSIADKEALLHAIRPSFYKEYLHVHYLAVRDGLKDSDELERVLEQFPDHWRNHLFMQQTNRATNQNAESKLVWLSSLSAEHAERYRCWFYMECEGE